MATVSNQYNTTRNGSTLILNWVEEKAYAAQQSASTQFAPSSGVATAARITRHTDSRGREFPIFDQSLQSDEQAKTRRIHELQKISQAPSRDRLIEISAYKKAVEQRNADEKRGREEKEAELADARFPANKIKLNYKKIIERPLAHNEQLYTLDTPAITIYTELPLE